MSLLLDLEDERRSAKPWLPESDKDVTEGRVVRGSREHDGKPECVDHGAMHSIAPSADDQHRLYRCSTCGVGAVWYPTNSPTAKRTFSKEWDRRVT